ncbi:hypothetical protein MALGJ_05870 [Mycolicibacter algericus]|uniref:Uncharacterized protein n=1 Tax=Mycolicibacter algericus TaxID=1288388 RepID=A0A7I9Y5G7_MYCAL|nr:hypothetical protein MALGJ_05870 [Mycolicibacter algericus]
MPDFADWHATQQNIRIDNEAIDICHGHGEIDAIRRWPNPNPKRSDIAHRKRDHQAKHNE